MKISIPTSLSEITVEQYQRYNRVLNLDIDDEAKTIGAISIFCNVSIEDVMLMPIDEVKEISTILFNTLALEPKFIQHFGKYAFEPNIDDITTAVYLDAEKYILDIESAHRALAVMYREVDKRMLGNYTIKPYEGSDKLCEEMLNAPLEVYLGLRLFFWTLSKDLLKATKAYLCNPSKEVEQLEETLAKNGGGIQALIQSLTDLELVLSKPLF